MKDEKKILEEASAKLHDYTGLSVKVDYDAKKKMQGHASLWIGQKKFNARIANTISNGNKAAVFIAGTNSKEKLPYIIVAQYIPAEIAEEYVANRINYLDIAGNSSIREKDLFIQITGKKKEKIPKVNQSRAFQEAGIKLLFNLLIDPKNVNLTYRELSQLADISLGSVGNIMQELIELNFVMPATKGKVLKNLPLLLQRWVTAYHDVLRPRLLLKKMRFTKVDQHDKWDILPIQDADDIVLWGGEPAAALLTNYLLPEKFTLYTNNSWQGLMREVQLLPEETGPIEILRIFWNEKDTFRQKYIVPPLLIYADLMGNNIGRNIETAKMILENELSYLK
jgi:hypothetical protein